MKENLGIDSVVHQLETAEELKRATRGERKRELAAALVSMHGRSGFKTTPLSY